MTDSQVLELKKKSLLTSEIKENCVLLLDCSTSMVEWYEDQRKIDILKDAIPSLNTPYTAYALIGFADVPTIYKEFTYKFGSIISASQSLVAMGNTQMALGLSLAISLFLHSVTVKKRIILLSDGEPTCSRDDVINEAKKCKESDIIIDTIAIGHHSFLLAKISEMTGGLYKESNMCSPISLSFDMAKMFKELRYEKRYIGYDNSN